MSGRKKNIYVLTFGNMHERDMKPQREHVRSLSSGIGDSVEITRAYNPDQNCTEYRAELVGIDGIQPTAHGSNEGDALRNLYTRIDELKESRVIA